MYQSVVIDAVTGQAVETLLSESELWRFRLGLSEDASEEEIASKRLEWERGAVKSQETEFELELTLEAAIDLLNSFSGPRLEESIVQLEDPALQSILLSLTQAITVIQLYLTAQLDGPG